MDQIASWALECPDVKATGSTSGTRQDRCRLAIGTTWSLDGHEIRLGQAGARHSQLPVKPDAVWWRYQHALPAPAVLVLIAHLQK